MQELLHSVLYILFNCYSCIWHRKRTSWFKWFWTSKTHPPLIKLHRFIDSREAVLLSARSGSQNSAVFQLNRTTRNLALRHNHHAQAQTHYLSCRQTPFLTAKHSLTLCLRRKLHCTFQNSFPKMHKMSNSQNRLLTGIVIYSVNTSKIKYNSFEYSFPFTLDIPHTFNHYVLLNY